MLLKIISTKSEELLEGHIRTVKLANPYKIKEMGTSGLRLKQTEFDKPDFLEQFVQGIADYFKPISSQLNNNTILIGGDPRLGNKERLEKTAKILIANGFKVITAEDGIISTPAISAIIKKLGTIGGIILTASHNPYTDVGIKVNDSRGGGMLEKGTKEIWNFQNKSNQYKISNLTLKEAIDKKSLEYIDAPKLYADTLDKIFDFKKMKKDLAGKNMHIALDGMSGAAGPFIKEIFLNRLGLTEGKNLTFIGCLPDKYLGGLGQDGHPKHPEPDYSYIPDLIRLNNTNFYDLLAAYDSDVDRRLDGGKNFWIESADEFALIMKYADLFKIHTFFDTPAEKGKAKDKKQLKPIYLGRSLVTANAIDLMKADLDKKYKSRGFKTEIAETPTGFKYISELGNWGVEESNGLGNLLHGEKDGISATLMLLKIMLKTGKTVPQLIEDLWKKYGRVYFTRGEVSDPVKTEDVKVLTNIFDEKVPKMIGQKFGQLTLEKIEKPKYLNPLSKKEEDPKTWVFTFSNGNVLKARFSGTGSGGYCLRVYATKYDKDYKIEKKIIVNPLKEAFDDMLSKTGFHSKSKGWIDTDQPDPYKKK